MEALDRMLPRIEELLDRKEWHDLRNLLSEQPAQDIAEFVTGLEEEKRVVVFRLLSRPLATEVFSSPLRDRCATKPRTASESIPSAPGAPCSSAR